MDRWLNDVDSYTQLEGSLKAGEYINDVSGFMLAIINAESQSTRIEVAKSIISHQFSDGVLFASNNETLISQSMWDGLWGGFTDGVGWIIGGIAGVTVWAVFETSGAIKKNYFQV
jgi:hypothetical protein